MPVPPSCCLPAGALSTTSYEQLFATLKVKTVEMKKLGFPLSSIPEETIPEETHAAISESLKQAVRENEDMLPVVKKALTHLGEWPTAQPHCSPAMSP